MIKQGNLPEDMTFEEFVNGLRVLQQRGEIVVMKWPRDAADTFQVIMLGERRGPRVGVA